MCLGLLLGRVDGIPYGIKLLFALGFGRSKLLCLLDGEGLPLGQLVKELDLLLVGDEALAPHGLDAGKLFVIIVSDSGQLVQ